MPGRTAPRRRPGDRARSRAPVWRRRRPPAGAGRGAAAAWSCRRRSPTDRGRPGSADHAPDRRGCRPARHSLRAAARPGARIHRADRGPLRRPGRARDGRGRGRRGSPRPLHRAHADRAGRGARGRRPSPADRRTPATRCGDTRLPPRRRAPPQVRARARGRRRRRAALAPGCRAIRGGRRRRPRGAPRSPARCAIRADTRSEPGGSPPAAAGDRAARYDSAPRRPMQRSPRRAIPPVAGRDQRPWLATGAAPAAASAGASVPSPSIFTCTTSATLRKNTLGLCRPHST